MKDKLIEYLVKLWKHICVFFTKIYLFTKRLYNNEGPHSKHCKCSKWGIYIDIGCPDPGHKLIIRGGTKLVKR